MSLPVIANVYRITLEWSVAQGISPRNIIHVRSTSTDETAVGTAFVAALQDHQFEGMADDHVLNSIQVLPLDGASASVEVDGGGYSSGSGSGDRSPASCIVVSHRTAIRGAPGRGRTYVGPILEAVMHDGTIDSTNATEIASAWVDFNDALVAGTPALEHVVASYAHRVANTVTSERCDIVLGTQRRRQNQLR